MTNSALAERPGPRDLVGFQEPRLRCLPDPGADFSDGDLAVELATDAGLKLDEWQRTVLRQSLGRRGGRWAAFEAVMLVSRQNGKGTLLEARELAGLYLFDERLILHSAHEYKTAVEGFRRIRDLIDGRDHLRRRVKRVITSHGEESIELLGGKRLRFLARSTGSGRGFTGDTIVLDEAQNLDDPMVEAMMPTVSARPDPQVIYAATAPDKDLAPCGHLAKIRRRALKGGDPHLAYFEWSIDPHSELCPPGCAEHDDPASVHSWQRANPGLGIRISVEHIAREYASMSAAGFGRERLGVGNWPADETAWQVISEEAWRALADPASQVVDPVAFAADVTPDRSYGSLAVAGRRADGLLHVEVVDHRPRAGWLVERLLQLQKRWRPCAVVVDPTGPAGSLIAAFEAAGVEVIRPSMREAAQACGAFYDLVTDAKALRHLDQPPLAVALAGAERRPLSDAWAWDRKSTQVDISPLVAVTLAAWGHATRAHLLDSGDPHVYVF